MITEIEVIKRVPGLTKQLLELWISEGWVAPSSSPIGYIFSEIDIARLHLIKELKTDLEINSDGIPIVLSLMDQVHGLRYELRKLACAIEEQHDDVQRQIIAAIERHSDERE